MHHSTGPRTPTAEPGEPLSTAERSAPSQAAERQCRCYETALANTPVMHCIFDLDQRMVYVNPAVERWLDRVAADIVGKDARELGLPAHVLQAQCEGLDRVIANGETVVVDMVLAGADGDRSHRCQFQPVRDEQGRIEAVAGSMIDISAQLRAQAALGQDEERYRQLAEALPQIVWVRTAEGKLDYFNQRWYDYTGCTPALDKGRSWASCMHPNDLPGTLARWQQALHVGQPFETEYRLRDAQGRFRWFLGRSLPVRDAAGHILRWVGTATDIEEFKQLQSHKVRLAQLVEHSQDFIGMAGLDVPGLYLNPAGMALVGIDDTAELKQMNMLDLVHPLDRAGLDRAQIEAMMSQRGSQREIRLRHAKTDEPIWIDWRVFPVRDATGQVNALGTISQDIRQRRASEARQRQLVDELSEADRRKDEFLATLAHELRNPLAPIVNATRLLGRGDLPAQQTAELARMLERQVAQVVRLVDDLIDVSRLSLGKIALQRDSVDPNDVVTDALAMASPLAQEKRQQVHVDIAPQLPRLHADRLRLTQALGNLLHNACKFTPEGGRIEVQVCVRGAEVVLTVRDNGIGIAADDLPRLFRMFGQLGRDAPMQSGLGIGLSLARSMVELHGGRIEAHSAGAGQGCEFELRLPVQTQQTVDDARSDKTEATAAGAAAHTGLQARPRQCVLVVDDNEDAAASLAMLLEMEGHEVAQAFSGEQALALSAARRPDVVLLDIGMPGMSGHDVARAMRQRDGANAPWLVALTGWGHAGDRERSRQAGFDAHLVKPVSIQELLALLAEWEAGAP